LIIKKKTLLLYFGVKFVSELIVCKAFFLYCNFTYVFLLYLLHSSWMLSRLAEL